MHDTNDSKSFKLFEIRNPNDEILCREAQDFFDQWKALQFKNS